MEKANDEPEVIGIQTSSVCENKNNVGTFINLFKEKLLGEENYNEYLEILYTTPGSKVLLDSETSLYAKKLEVVQNSDIEVKGSLIIGPH